jgi:hypothetical protein
MDEVLTLRKQHGWSSDLLKSDEWRQMKTKWGGLILKKKNIEKLGAVTGSDLDLVGNALGATDPTSLQDPTAGIETARRESVKGLHEKLTLRRVGPKSLPLYPETWKYEKPEPSTRNKRITSLTDFDQLIDPDAAVATGSPAAAGEMERLRGAGRDAKLTISDLIDDARAGDSVAKAGLEQLAKDAVHPLVKKWASEGLATVRGASEGR